MGEYKVCHIGELTEATPYRAEFEGRKLALVRIQERIYAISDTCSHEDVSLSDGEVDLEECALECWKHGSLFSLETGEALSLPATKSVETYKVTISGDDVFLVIE
tara:strand:+ start:61 stop:375 length:315 start_codon:yes stop_codon:yes gene_type:complete